MLTRLRKTLPVPLEAARAGDLIGYVGGRPVYLQGGGAQDDDKDDDAGDDDAGDDDGEDGKDDDAGDDDGEDKELGPKGERALAAEKLKRRNAQAALREWKALGLTPAEAKKLLEAKTDAGEKLDPEKIKEQGRTEARAELQRERVLDKIEVAAARGFKDPDDAAALLLKDHDPNDFLDDNGKIDVEAIQDALKDLLDSKPYLGADAQGDGRRFKGSGDGGARKDARPNQLSRDQLARMSPQEIVKAKAEGRLDDVLAGKR